MALLTLGASAQTLTWSAEVAIGSATSLTLGDADFGVTLIGDETKTKVQAKSLTFKVSESSSEEKFEYQWCPGGGVTKTDGTSARCVAITVSKAGVLTIYPRSAGSDDRAFTLQQNDATILEGTAYNAVQVKNDQGEAKYYKAYTVEVAKGTIYFLAESAVNISGFKFVANPEGEATAGKIYWTEAVTAGSLPASFSDGGLTMTRTDTDNKHAIDSNNAWFGDATNQVKYGFRFKTGGKSSAKNGLTLTVPAAGTLKICVRTASGSDETRTMVLTQNGTELYKEVVKESDAISVDIEAAKSETNPTGTTNVHPIREIPVAAGTIEVTYPNNAINFYAIEYVPTASGIEAVKSVKVAQDNVIYNLAGQKVGADYKGIAIMNGKKVVLK